MKLAGKCVLWLGVTSFLLILSTVTAVAAPSSKTGDMGICANDAPFPLYLQEHHRAQEAAPLSYARTLNFSEPLNGLRIVLDPGHGGLEPGAVGNGIIEKELTFIVALKVKALLQSKGACVYMTHEQPLSKIATVPLNVRASLARDVDAELFISIHFNSNTDASVHGTETYYNKDWFEESRNPFPEKSEQLANMIQRYTVIETKTKNMGVRENHYHVLRNNSVPSALVEVAYISNIEEARKAKTESFLHSAAVGITNGVQKYVESTN